MLVVVVAAAAAIVAVVIAVMGELTWYSIDDEELMYWGLNWHYNGDDSYTDMLDNGSLLLLLMLLLLLLRLMLLSWLVDY